MSSSSGRGSGGPPAEAGSPPAEDVLFEEAVSDVAPLAQEQRPPEQVPPEPVALSARDHEVIRELDALVAGEGEFELQNGDEFMEGAVPGLDPRVLRRLRRGEFATQAQLDLHGSDAESARSRVESFVCDSHATGLRCLKIVHGRGRNSPGGVPVIKTSLPRWLSRGPARRLVLAYTSALPGDGGTGASYVLLRKNR